MEVKESKFTDNDVNSSQNIKLELTHCFILKFELGITLSLNFNSFTKALHPAPSPPHFPLSRPGVAPKSSVTNRGSKGERFAHELASSLLMSDSE